MLFVSPHEYFGHFGALATYVDTGIELLGVDFSAGEIVDFNRCVAVVYVGYHRIYGRHFVKVKPCVEFREAPPWHACQ